MVRFGARFCRNCGAQLSWPTEKQSHQQQGFEYGKAQDKYQIAECPTCGAKIPLGLRFCDNCGVELRGQAKQQQPPEQQQPYQHEQIQVEHKKMNSGLIVFIVLIIATLLVGGYVFIFTPFSQKTPPSSYSIPATPAPPAPPATPLTETPPTPPPATVITSYPATTYINDKYGFSIQYPKDWVARPELLTTPNHLAAFGIEAFVPGVVCMVFDKPEATTKDWIVSSFKSTGTAMPEVTSEVNEITLSDGTKAYVYTAGYVSPTGYDIVAYCLDAVKGDKQFRINVWTVDSFFPYDGDMFSEIAKTLTFGGA